MYDDEPTDKEMLDALTAFAELPQIKRSPPIMLVVNKLFAKIEDEKRRNAEYAAEAERDKGGSPEGSEI